MQLFLRAKSEHMFEGTKKWRGDKYFQQIGMQFELCCGLSVLIELMSEVLYYEQKLVEVVVGRSAA